jgi:hypothetical protein
MNLIQLLKDNPDKDVLSLLLKAIPDNHILRQRRWDALLADESTRALVETHNKEFQRRQTIKYNNIVKGEQMV